MNYNTTIWSTRFYVILGILALSTLSPISTRAQSNLLSQRIEQLTLNNHSDSLALALQLSSEINDPILIEKSLTKIIEYNINASNLNLAIQYQLQLETHFEKYPDPKKELSLATQMGETYLAKKYPEKAISYFFKSKTENSKADNMALLEKIAESYYMMSKLDSCLIFYNLRLAHFKKDNDTNNLIESHQKIASLLSEVGNHQKALEQNIDLNKIAVDINNDKLLANTENNIGNNYNALNDYKDALKHFKIAEKLNKRKNYLDESILYTNIGIVYSNIGDLKNAIKYLQKSEKEISKRKDKNALINLYQLLSTIYYTNGDLHNALNYANRAIDLAKQTDNRNGLKETYLTSALIYQDFYEYEKALSFYQKHLSVRDSILVEERLEKQAIIQDRNNLEKSEKELKLLLANQEVQNLIINQLELEKEKLNLSSEKLKLEAARKASELELLKKEQEVADSKIKNQKLIAEQAEQKLILSEQRLNNQIALQKLNEATQKERLTKVELEKNEAIKNEKENEIELLTKDKELLTKDKLLLTNEQRINQLQLKQDAAFKNTAYIVGSILGLSGFIFLLGLLNFRRKNILLGKQKNEIEKQKEKIQESNLLIAEEKSKSDALLLNILPKETATELKAYGVATPKKYESVSVLFTDFSKFTSLSEGLSAEELIQELNQYFLAFDDICEKYNIEKIKTIGDAYMCASGLPVESKSHALDIVAAAKEMQQFVAQRNQKRRASELPAWEMRAGIHSGPIIAGVVGSKKFTYDIWGDTVNTASRMETAADLGRINISSTTYALVKDQITCTYRGKLEAKNKGYLEMYHVE